MDQRRYQIPTHLSTPDRLDIPLFGLTISLTIRQGVVFLLGGSLVYHLWQQSFGHVGMMGVLLHWIVPFILAFATYVVAYQEIRGRYLEIWALVLAQYLRCPKVYFWQSVVDPVREDTEEERSLIVPALDEEEES